MSGTKPGSVKAVKTIYAKYGRDFFARAGAIGGSRSTTGGFYANRELASRAGAIGGRLSRRGNNKLSEQERRKIRREYETAYEDLLKVHTKAQQERQAAQRHDTGAVTVYDRIRGLIRL